MKILKKVFISILIFFLLFELTLFVSLKFNLNGLRANPIIIYNPYCDQKYWLTRDQNVKISKDVSYHPILTYKMKNTIIPNDLDNPLPLDQSSDLALYGTSFIGHNIFKGIVNDSELINFNYALPSYGLDQMYLSYLLTESAHQNKPVIFGFLLEDIDRMIFSFRDYKKVTLSLGDDGVNLLNVPINVSEKPKKSFSLLSVSSVTNLFKFARNGFDFSNSSCFKKKKIKLLDFILNDMIERSKKNNQKLIIVTFRLETDFKKENWRYIEVKKLLNSKEITWLDSQAILSQGLDDKALYSEFYARDRHLNEKGFAKVFSSIQSSIKEQYK